MYQIFISLKYSIVSVNVISCNMREEWGQGQPPLTVLSLQYCINLICK